MKRPKVALSELAETLTANVQALEEMKDKILDNNSLIQLKQSLSDITHSMEQLNTKNNAAASSAQVKRAIRSIIAPNEALDKIMQSVYMTGCTLATLSTQFLVAKSLLQNPNEYGSLVHASDQSDKDCKFNRDFKSMKYFLIQSCAVAGCSTSAQTESARKRSILKLFDSSDEGTSDERQTKRRKKSHWTVQPITSSTEVAMMKVLRKQL